MQHQHEPIIDLLALIGRDTRLRKGAATCGGEYIGACPRCGGDDRLRVQPNAQPKPRWTCRYYLGTNHWPDTPGYLMWRDGLSYPAALTALGLPTAPRSGPAIPIAPDDSVPPASTWQHAAARFVDAVQRALWHDRVGAAARAYLHRRGFTDATIRKAGLGYNMLGRHSPFSTWGLPDDPHRAGVWLPPGIVIPWYVDGQVWKVTVRQPHARPKYLTITGSANVLYNIDTVRADCVAVLAEGPLDALAIEQAAGDLAVGVASGLTGARRMRWITCLARCSDVLVAFDAEETTNREVARAIAYWIDVLHPRAHRLSPTINDPAAMLEQGEDVRAWLVAGRMVHP